MLKTFIIRKLPLRMYLFIRRIAFRAKNYSEYKHKQSLRNRVTASGYSFMPCDEKKAIFIHIPKCAGISLNKAVFGCLGAGHVSLNGYLDIFEPRFIDQYFKFTVVRNPWDRLVSAFFFLKSGGFNDTDRLWAEKELAEFHNFDDFVRRWVNEKNIMKFPHFFPQSYFLFDRHSKVDIDFIAYFENLYEDFSYIKTYVDVESDLKINNLGAHRTYAHYYTQESMQIVSKVYSEDIDLLGYDFHNHNLNSQLEERRKFGNLYLKRSR